LKAMVSSSWWASSGGCGKGPDNASPGEPAVSESRLRGFLEASDGKYGDLTLRGVVLTFSLDSRA
jgi:hypothetical protein